MIRVVANIDGDLYALDVKGSVSYNINGRPIDAQGKNAGSYSSSFQMPFSPANSQFFEYFYDVNVEQDTFNHYEQINVEVYDGQTFIFRGQLQLLSVNIFKKHYEVMVISDTTSLFSKIRGMTWRELFREEAGLSAELDHTRTTINIILSWNTTQDITNGGVGAGTVVYALTDNATRQTNPRRWFLNGPIDADTPPYQQGINGAGAIQPYELSPTIRVRYLIQKIMQKTGFVYDSDFIDSTLMDKLYMVLGNQFTTVRTRAAYGCKGNPTADVTVTAGNTDFTEVLFADEAYDPDNLLQQGVFVAPSAGVYQLKYSIFGQGTAGDELVMGVTVNEDATVYTMGYATIPSNVTTGVIRYVTLQLNEGDNVRFYIKSYSAQDYVVDTFSYLELDVYEANNAQVDMVANMPDCTVDEWLRAIAQEFNLVIVPAGVDTNTVIIEPLEDFYARGVQVKDWTNKIDLDKDVIIRPTTEQQSRTLTFTDAEGTDFHNKYWQFAFGHVKGKHDVENENVHAQGTETIGEFFAPLRMGHVGTFDAHNATVSDTLFVINRWNLDNGVAKPQTGPPMLAFYHGSRSTGNFDIKLGEFDIVAYPMFTHLETQTQGATSLRWGHSWPDHVNDSYFPQTVNHLFRKFYAKSMERVYSVHARTMYCTAHLTATDISQLELYDRIWVYNAYYRLISIQGFAIGSTAPCKIELLKDIDVTAFNCSLIPDSFNDDGTVGFVNAQTGQTAVSNEECCTYYGFAWDSENNSCLWSGGDDSAGEPPVVPNGDDTTTPVNEVPPYPPTEPQVDTSTGYAGSQQTMVFFAETVSTETVTFADAQGVSKAPIPTDTTGSGFIQIVGKRLLNSGDGMAETMLFHYDTEGGTFQVTTVDKSGNDGTVTARAASTGNGLEILVQGVNGEPMAWMAVVNLNILDPRSHQLPTVSDIHGADALFNGGTNVYITFNGGNDHLIFNG